LQNRKIKLAVGTFIITMSISICILLYIAIQNSDMFNTRYNYHFKTDSAEFFTVGMPLKLSGFKIGVLDTIKLNDNGSVYMTFSVNKKNKKWLTKGTILIVTQPLIGSANIDVYTSLDSPKLKVGSELMIMRNDNINDTIVKLEPVVGKINNIITNIEIITSNLSKTDSDIAVTMSNIKEFTTKLLKNNSLLTTITGDKESTKNIILTLNKTTKIMNELDTITTNIGKTTSSLNQDIIKPASSVIKELNLIMKDITKKLNKIDGTVTIIGDSNQDLLNIKEQIEVGLQKSNLIMDKIDSILQNNNQNEIPLP